MVDGDWHLFYRALIPFISTCRQGKKKWIVGEIISILKKRFIESAFCGVAHSCSQSVSAILAAAVTRLDYDGVGERLQSTESLLSLDGNVVRASLGCAPVLPHLSNIPFLNPFCVSEQGWRTPAHPITDDRLVF